jgi:glycosyltransferase involved in cell wall biosynthesis
VARQSVTAIVVVRNGERFLRSALDSILVQDYEPLEILVIDGSSSDGSARIAKGMKGVRYLRQTDDGLANARNLGIAVAAGDVLAFLDADDLWAEGKLRTQMDHLDRHVSDSGCVAWLRFVIDEDYGRGNPWALEFYGKDVAGYTPGTLVARKALFREVGLFNPAYSVASDSDWFARARDLGVSLPLVPQVLLSKRIHGTNMSLKTRVTRQETMALLHESLRRKRAMHGMSLKAVRPQDLDDGPELTSACGERGNE